MTRRSYVPLLLVLLAGFVAHVPSLANGFTNDDRYVALGVGDDGRPNRRIHELQPPHVYFTTHYWADTYTTGKLYRPVTVLSFALRYAVFGDAAFPAHLANVLLHVVATWLVFRLLFRLCSLWPALAGAAVFAVHALHVEVVATVVGRAELLAFACGAGALELWLASDAMTGARRRAATAGVAVLLFLALCSKEVAVAWPAVFFAYLFAGEPAAWRQHAVRSTLVAVLPLAVFFALRHFALGSLPPAGPTPYLNNPLFAAPLGERLLGATEVMGHGMGLSVLPIGLCSDYGAAVFDVGTLDFDCVAAIAAILVFAVVGLAAQRRSPVTFFGVAAFFGFALVTSNHLLPIGTIFGERLYYPPSLGVAALVAALAATLHRSGLTRAGAVLIGAWLVASMFLAMQRGRAFRSNESLFLRDAKAQPSSIRLQVAAAAVHRQRGRTDEAVRRLERALAVDPDVALPWISLTAIRLEQNDLAEAERCARRGLAARHKGGAGGEAPLRYYLGVVRRRRGDPEGSVRELATALQLQPSLWVPWPALWRHRRDGTLTPRQLLDLLYECERNHPGKPHWPALRGVHAHHERLWEAAVKVLEPSLDALSRDPEAYVLYTQARFSYGHSLLELGRTDEAEPILTALANDEFVDRAIRVEARKLLER